MKVIFILFLLIRPALGLCELDKNYSVSGGLIFLVDEIPELSLKINKQRNLILQKKLERDEMLLQFNNSILDRRGKRILTSQIDKIETDLVLFEDKLNCYLLAQKLINQLQYLPNYKKNTELKKIIYLIDQIDADKIKYHKAHKKYYIPVLKNQYSDYLPEEDCKFEMSSDGKIIANQKQILLTYTPKELEKHYTNSEFLIVYTKLLKSNKKYYLDLKFEFKGQRVTQFYGIFVDTNPLKLGFLDEDYLVLQNMVSAPPQIDKLTGNTIYKFQCPLTKSDLKKLARKEVDKLTIVWPTATETYEVFNLHIYQNLSKCLQIKN
ncbi:MAG: hypothetical protein IT267_05030 [Saprospiraceae bacterium]|nr:hypothetical protein [Saprospiraceae bacterium]